MPFPTPNPESLAFPLKLASGVTTVDPRAARSLLLLMNTHAVMGGAACHWGGPAALTELVGALYAFCFEQSKTHQKEWFELSNIVNDIGHAQNIFYATLALFGADELTFNDLKKFRSIDSKLTGHGEYHLNPTQVLFSNGPLASCLAPAQGLAIADKLKNINRTTWCFLSDGALMEGEAKEVLCSLPGLSKKNKVSPFVVILSDNQTKLSGNIAKNSFSQNEYIATLSTLGFQVIKLGHPHDAAAAYEAVSQAHTQANENPTRPVLLWAQTIKGKGIKSFEQTETGSHGFPLKGPGPDLNTALSELWEGSVPALFLDWAKELELHPKAPAQAGVKVQQGISRALIEAKELRLPVFCVSADLQGSTGVSSFQAKFPEQHLDMGIAESNMIGVASGLSRGGFIPVVDTFAQFGVTKGLLPLTMGALSQTPLIALFSHTGMQDAADGASHQALTYLGATLSIPNTEIIICATASEAYHYLSYALKHFQKTPNSYLFFFGRENFPECLTPTLNYPFGSPQVLFEDANPNLLIIANGPLLVNLFQELNTIQQHGIRPILVNHSFLKTINTSFYENYLKKVNCKVLIAEDHQIIGGFGEHFVATISEHLPVRAKICGHPGTFGQSAYQASDLYRARGLSVPSIAAAGKALLLHA